jgi:hypothetical protein
MCYRYRRAFRDRRGMAIETYRDSVKVIHFVLR